MKTNVVIPTIWQKKTSKWLVGEQICSMEITGPTDSQILGKKEQDKARFLSSNSEGNKLKLIKYLYLKIFPILGPQLITKHSQQNLQIRGGGSSCVFSTWLTFRWLFYIFVCVHVFRYTCASMWRQKNKNLGVIRNTIHFLWDSLSLAWDLTNSAGWLASKPLGILLSVFSMLGLEAQAPTTPFYLGAGNPSSGSHACKASTLLSHLPYLPPLFFLRPCFM